jgi:gliding motility-associated-like protein
VILELFVEPALEETIAVEICYGGSYEFHGVALSSEGTYTDTVITSEGCDSIITLELTIAPIIETTIIEEICSGTTYDFHGEILSVSGVYEDTLETAEGCDSVVILELFVEPALEETVAIEICDGGSYDFHGEILTDEGTYVDTLPTTEGCDSIITLELTISPIIETTVIEEICSGTTYDFHGEILSASGVYEDTLETAEGCDSLVILELFVEPALEETIEVEICEGGSYDFNGTEISVEGTYFDTLTTSEGCDSIITLILTIGSGLEEELVAEICEGSSYPFFGENYTEAGEYVHTLTTEDGCDSSIILNLRVSDAIETTIEAEICQGATYDFNGTPLTEEGTYSDTLQTTENCDSIVILELSVSEAIVEYQFIEICNGGSYTYDGVTYTSEGTYVHVFETSEGCDSMVELTLSMEPTISNTINRSICQGDTYNFHGDELALPGTYTKWLETAEGCDSILHLELAVLETIETTLEVQICEDGTYDFNGVILEDPGTYLDTLESSGGCDSIVTLQLSHEPFIIGYREQTICEGENVVFHGETLTEQGFFVEMLEGAAANGCDSMDALYLFVNESYDIDLNVTICEGESYLFNGNELTNSTQRTARMQTEAGCDSTVRLNLTVMSEFNTVVDSTICSGSFIEWQGEEIDSSGTYVSHLVSGSGCDSTVELNLTVAPEYQDTLSTHICLTDSLEFNGQYFHSAGTYEATFQSQSGCDSVVILELDVSPEEFLHLDFEICEGDTFTLHGRDYYQEGVYFDTLGTVRGCDSLLEINLTVKEMPSEIIHREICPGEVVYINSVMYDRTGTFLDTLQAQSGCDSVLFINIDHLPVPEIVTEREICHGETTNWQGNIINTSGTYSDTLTSANGCDSIVTLDLTVHPEFSSSGTATLCEGESMVWNGRTIDTAGTYSTVLQAQSGCDSLVQLDVDHAQKYNYAIQLEVCEGDTLEYEDRSFYEEGTFVEQHQSAQGCDSTVTYHISMLTQYEEVESIEICEGETWPFYGVELDQPGTYSQEFQTVTGCDSIEILELSVRPNTRDTITVNICEGQYYSFRDQDLRFEGTYTDTVAGNNECYHIHTLVLDVHPNEIMINMPDDTIVNLGDEIQISPQITSPNGLGEFFWSPIDALSCAECVNTWAAPLKTTTYTFYIRDTVGCELDARITIFVDTNVDIYIPNVFSPNRDGINDMFFVQSGGGVEEIEKLQIYDRWGERVFETRNIPPNEPLFGWDGTRKGQDMNPAVFVYTTTVRLDNGQRLILKGDVTLVR